MSGFVRLDNDSGHHQRCAAQVLVERDGVNLHRSGQERGIAEDV